MAAIRDLIARALYPPDAVCIACGRLRVDAPGDGLCARCAGALVPLEGPFCPRCGAPGWQVECMDCAGKPPSALGGMASPFAYEGVAERLVRALKYGRVLPAADALARAMAQSAPEGPFDAIVPVPLHKRRQRMRGFNQAGALCVALSPLLNLPTLDALRRTRATRTQTRLSAERRQENVQGAFEAIAPVSGLRLLLVDDVLTTGATAAACAEVLKAQGAARVFLLAAARAEEGAQA